MVNSAVGQEDWKEQEVVWDSQAQGKVGGGSWLPQEEEEAPRAGSVLPPKARKTLQISVDWPSLA